MMTEETLRHRSVHPTESPHGASPSPLASPYSPQSPSSDDEDTRLTQGISRRICKNRISVYALLPIFFFIHIIIVTNSINVISSYGANSQTFSQRHSLWDHPLAFFSKIFNMVAPSNQISPHPVNSFDPRSPFTSVFEPLAHAHCTQRWCHERSKGMQPVTYAAYEDTPFGVLGRGEYSPSNNPDDTEQVALADPLPPLTLHVPPLTAIPNYPRPLYSSQPPSFFPHRQPFAGPPELAPLRHHAHLYAAAPAPSPITTAVATIARGELDSRTHILPLGNTFTFAMVADRDHHSACRDDGHDNLRATGAATAPACERDGKWHTHVRRGQLQLEVDEQALAIARADAAAGKPIASKLPLRARVSLGERVPLSTALNSNGRAIELSELHWHDGRFLTVCDYTGVMYTLRPLAGEIYPRYILADGDGREQRTLKAEWIASQGHRVLIGSHGKEWVEDGAIRARGAEFVKIVDGTVRSVDWQHVYRAIRLALGASFPGYVSHEAVTFVEAVDRWVFLPRKLSRCPLALTVAAAEAQARGVPFDGGADAVECGYSDEADETRGANVIISLPNFNVVDVVHRSEQDKQLPTRFRFRLADGSFTAYRTRTELSPRAVPAPDQPHAAPAALDVARAAGLSVPADAVDMEVDTGALTLALSACDGSVRHMPFHPAFELLPPQMRAWALGAVVRNVASDGSAEDPAQFGFASVATVPGTEMLLATRILERGGVTRTRVCVLDMQGNMYSQPCEEAGGYKYEGADFVGPREHY